MTEMTTNPSFEPTRPPVRPLVRALNVLATTAALAGVLAAAFEHGFWRPPLPLEFLRTVQVAAAAALVIDLAGRFALASDRREFLSHRRVDLAILALLAIGFATLAGRSLAIGGDAPSLLAHWCGLIDLFIAAQTLVYVARLVLRVAHSDANPITVLVAGFLVLIVLGTAGLMLPRSAPQGLPLYGNDALFTATSAATLTGLTTRVIGSDQLEGTPKHLQNPDLDTAEVSVLGQAIIGVLIQLGGLGMMIFATTFALQAGWLRSSWASRRAGIGRAVRFIVAGTLLVEVIGAILLYTMVADFRWPTGQKVFFAVFHSVSAFCNAGFTLMPDSFIRYHAYWQVHCVIAPLVVLGGLGWPVLMNLFDIVAGWFSRGAKALNASSHLNASSPLDASSHSELTLHSRLALSATGILLMVGLIGLMLTESPLTGRGRVHVGMRQPTPSAIEMAAERKGEPDPHQLRRESTGRQLVDSLFLSVNARSGGFTTVDTNGNGNALGDASLFLLTLLMMIGGSPGSAGGGLKTVTFVLIVLAVVSIIRRSRSGPSKEPRQAGARLADVIPSDIIRRAGAVFVCYLGFVLAVTFVLTITEAASSVPFMQLLFEAVSGTTSTGLGTGMTKDLTPPGQVVMMLAMFVGRLGPLALLMAITPTNGESRGPGSEGVAIA